MLDFCTFQLLTTLISRKNWEIFKIEKIVKMQRMCIFWLLTTLISRKNCQKLKSGRLFLLFVKKDKMSDFRSKRNLNFPATKAAVLTSTDFKTKQVFPEKIPFLDYQTRYGKIYCYGKFNLYFKTNQSWHLSKIMIQKMSCPPFPS